MKEETHVSTACSAILLTSTSLIVVMCPKFAWNICHEKKKKKRLEKMVKRKRPEKRGENTKMQEKLKFVIFAKKDLQNKRN